jgi:hypothetical protein
MRVAAVMHGTGYVEFNARFQCLHLLATEHIDVQAELLPLLSYMDFLLAGFVGFVEH